LEELIGRESNTKVNGLLANSLKCDLDVTERAELRLHELKIADLRLMIMKSFNKLNVTAVFIVVCMIIQSQFVPCEAREIEPEDVLEITVYEHNDLSITTRVSSDGYISFPLLGSLNVAGMTVRELEKEIEELLDNDYIVNSHVVVLTTEFRSKLVYVMGEVKKPQAIDLARNNVTTILEAITMAGGFTDTANRNKIKIIRTTADGTKENIKVKLSSIIKGPKNDRGDRDDTGIKAGDVIIISERRF